MSKNTAMNALLLLGFITIMSITVCAEESAATAFVEAPGRAVLNLNLSWQFHLNALQVQPLGRDFDDAAWRSAILLPTFKEVSLDLDQGTDTGMLET